MVPMIFLSGELIDTCTSLKARSLAVGPIAAQADHGALRERFDADQALGSLGGILALLGAEAVFGDDAVERPLALDRDSEVLDLPEAVDLAA